MNISVCINSNIVVKKRTSMQSQHISPDIIYPSQVNPETSNKRWDPNKRRGRLFKLSPVDPAFI